MTVHLVKTSKDLSDFIAFQRHLYKGNAYFVPPLEKMEKAFFSSSNAMAEGCDSALWLAKDGKTVVGRIAGIINHPFNSSQKTLQARFTHFDCIDDEAVAHLLLRTAEQWAKDKGMQEFAGPFGFNNLDKHGMLVEGFDELPCQSSNYNYPYYATYVESFGFKKSHDWVERQITIPSSLPPKMERFSKLLKERFKLSVVNVTSKADMKAIAPRMLELYNTTYASLYGVSPLNAKQQKQLLAIMIGGLDPDYLSVVVGENDEVVGFGVAMPSYSRSLQKAKGRFLPLGFYHLLRNSKNNPVLDLLLIGVHPDYRRKGLNAIIFCEIFKAIIKNGIKHVETTQNLESNTAVLNLWANFENRLHKRARLYTKDIQ